MDLGTKEPFRGLQVFMLLAWPGSTDDSLRWRGQAMTALEHCSRFHRMVVPLPVWHRYFQDGAGLGVVSASMCTGVVPVCHADASPAPVLAAYGALAKASTTPIAA